MARIVSLANHRKGSYRRASPRRAALEEAGQLNMFAAPREDEAGTASLSGAAPQDTARDSAAPEARTLDDTLEARVPEAGTPGDSTPGDAPDDSTPGDAPDDSTPGDAPDDSTPGDARGDSTPDGAALRIAAPGDTESCTNTPGNTTPRARNPVSAAAGNVRSLATVRRLDTGLSVFSEALLLDRRGRAGAEAAYQRAARLGDRPADAYCNLGTLAANAKQHSDALEWYSRALEAAPAHPEAHYNLGCLYLDLEMFSPARVHLGIAAADAPDEPELQFNLAIALAGIGRVHEAAAALRRYRVLAKGGGPAVNDDGADRLLDELERVLRERA